MCLELMENTIFHLSKNSDFNEAQIAYLIKETLTGVAFLHTLNRLHRDLKSDNILYNLQGDIKISDFGFSTQVTIDELLKTSMIGTPSWMAPEIVSGEGYSNKIDIWAIGVLVFELAEKKLPFSGTNSVEILCNARNLACPELSHKWGIQMKEFHSLCFEKNPELRPAASELLMHGFLEKASKEEFLKLILKNEENLC